MLSARNQIDEYERTKNRLVLTEKQFFIPGVRMFGHHKISSAIKSLDWHYHENAFEFSMPSKGSFTFSTPEEDFPYSGGDVFISYPNEIHGTNRTPVTLGDLYWFQLDISQEDHFLFLQPDAARNLIDSLKELCVHVIRTDLKQTLPLLKNAFRCGQKPETAPIGAAYLLLFLHLLIVYARESSPRISPDIQVALDFIRNHLTDELTLEQLAAAAHLSCSQFKQKFRKQLGTAPRQYINRQKIEYSQILLSEGKTITETAMLLNFSTSGYFSTVFKKYTRLTPGEYCRNLNSGNIPLHQKMPKDLQS